MPTFSILLPVYNHVHYVPMALDSVLAQTDPDWETVVIDDGSTDDTGAVVDAYAARDARFLVHHQANGGQARALNAALERATGDWICWLSSDDLFEPERLAVLRDHITAAPDCRFFFGAFQSLQEETQVLQDGPTAFNQPPEDPWRLINLLGHNFINGITICVHRRVFDAVGAFEPRYRFAQDYDLYLRVMQRYPTQFIEARTCVKRSHAEQWAVRERLAMFYQCSEATIRFLNDCPFEALFPGRDLDAPGQAEPALEQAMDMALSRHAYLNQLGVHTALLGRLAAWVSARAGRHGYRAVRQACWSLREAAVTSDPARRALCCAAYLALRVAPALAYVPVDPVDVARAALYRTAAGDEAHEQLRRFLAYLDAPAPDDLPAALPPEARRSILAMGPFADAASRDALALLARRGHVVVTLSPDASGMSVTAVGITVPGTSGWALMLALSELPAFDVVVAERRLCPVYALLGSRVAQASGADATERADALAAAPRAAGKTTLFRRVMRLLAKLSGRLAPGRRGS